MKDELWIFKALGEQTKHRILKELLAGELCACEIPGRIGATQSNCSMQLSKLVEWELLESRREGRKVIYWIKDERVRRMFAAIRGAKHRGRRSARNGRRKGRIMEARA